MDKEERDKIKNRVYIYLCGYKTGCGYSAEDYLIARDKVQTSGTNENMIHRRIMQSNIRTR